jgi:hypothetical protein
MYPSRPWDVRVSRLDYAPPYLVTRIRYGRYGTIDLEKMVTDGTSARPCQVEEAELKDLIHEYFPPVRYVSFHRGFVDVDWWQEFAKHEENLRRHAHSCLRIEAVVCSPTRTDCQRRCKRGGVHVQVRCTCCGELFTITTEIDGQNGATKTGFKIRGQDIGGPRGKPIVALTLRKWSPMGPRPGLVRLQRPS